MSGKKQAFVHREQLIITEAARLLEAEGYFGLSLDKLAQAVGYAKGTLYQHFKTKEDIVLAIAAQSMEERRSFFLRAAQFEGRPREKMSAIGIADRLFVQLFPGHFHVEHLIKARSLWAKTSKVRQTQLTQCEQECGATVHAIVESAIASGELELGEGNYFEVGLGLWTMALGMHTLVCSAGLAGDPQLDRYGITDPYESLWRNQQALLDGLHWAPLSSDWDYEHTRKRVLEEIFYDEWQKTNAR